MIYENISYESCFEDEGEDQTSKQATRARIGKGHHSQKKKKNKLILKLINNKKGSTIFCILD